MGQLFFPLRRPHPRGGGCQRRFRRDVPQSGCTHCPAAPVRTAAVPDVFFEGGCVFGRLAQLLSLRAASSRLTPSPPQACVLSGGPGDPGRSGELRPPVLPRSARAGPAAVRTALPCPVASSCSLTTVTQRQLRPQHAAADQQCTVLDARPSARWCHRAHPAAPPGRSFLDAVQTDADGTPNHRPDLGAAWLHLVVRSPAVSGVLAYLSPGGS